MYPRSPVGYASSDTSQPSNSVWGRQTVRVCVCVGERETEREKERERMGRETERGQQPIRML